MNAADWGITPEVAAIVQRAFLDEAPAPAISLSWEALAETNLRVAKRLNMDVGRVELILQYGTTGERIPIASANTLAAFDAANRAAFAPERIREQLHPDRSPERKSFAGPIPVVRNDFLADVDDVDEADIPF